MAARAEEIKESVHILVQAEFNTGGGKNNLCSGSCASNMKIVDVVVVVVVVVCFIQLGFRGFRSSSSSPPPPDRKPGAQSAGRRNREIPRIEQNHIASYNTYS